MNQSEEEDDIVFEETPDNEGVDENSENQDQNSKEENKNNSDINDHKSNEEHEDSTGLEKCRFYRSELPNVGDAVMTEIKGVTDYCGVVYLLEYGKQEAMIQFSEISNRRLRVKPGKILRQGKQEVMQVLKVNTERGMVDLTRKNLDPAEVEDCTRRFAESKTVHNILQHVSVACHVPLLELYETIVWPYIESQDQNPIELFKEAYKDPSVWKNYNLDENVISHLNKLIQHRLASHNVKVQATVEVTCYAYEGIDAIIASLHAGTSVEGVKINLIAPPLYAVYTLTSNLEEGTALVQKAINCIQQEIEKRKGKLSIQHTPSLISA